PLCLPVPPVNKQYVQFQSITLLNGQKLTNQHGIAWVQSIWRPDQMSDSKTQVIVRPCEQGDITHFYSMRVIVVTDPSVSVKVSAINRVLNVQHNCHEAECSVTQSGAQMIEQKASEKMIYGIKHNPTNSFILNSAAHYSSKVHRESSHYQFNQVSPQEWNEAIAHGVYVWTTEPPPQPVEGQGRGRGRGIDR
ncbi:hypothetical protein DFH28DRAFT_892385, partial [Melampsora americana]